MEYEQYYSALWDLYPQKGGALDKDDDIYLALSRSDAVTSQNAQRITEQQWIDSLAVASIFATNEGRAGQRVTLRVEEAANAWVAEIARHLGLDEACAISGSVFKAICESRVRPYFAAKPTNLRQFVLLSDPDKRAARVSTDKQKWEACPQSVAAFTWAFDHLKDDDVVSVVSYVLPVVLDLADNHSCEMKIRGLHLISSLLHRVDSGFLRKSGIASLVEQSVLNCLYYRAEEGSLGVELLRAAFQQATAVTAILYPDASDKQFTSRWWSIVDRLISNQAYVSDNVAASRALCEQITPVCKTLGIAATRYLRPLLGVVLQRLNSPVYLSPDICDLHLVLLDQISALINACQPRIHAYVADILAGLAFSWVSAHHRQCAKMKGVDLLCRKTTGIVGHLYRISPAKTRESAERLSSARPGTFAEWEEICSAAETHA